MKQKCFKIYTPTHTYIYVSRGRVYTISWVPESCKSMTHFPPVTLVKYSQLRLFGPRHDFSANNTLAHVGYISLITHTPPARRENPKIWGGNDEIRRLSFPPLSQSVPGIFSLGQQPPVARNVGRPAPFSRCTATPHTAMHATTVHPRNASGQGMRRWKVFHENLRDSEYNRKYEGGSTERNTSPCPTPRPNLTLPLPFFLSSLFSQQWPT